MTMAEKSNDFDKNKFKTMKNDALGASKAQKLKVGDLVSWDSWAESLETGVFEEKNGVLLTIFRDEGVHGWGYMGKIMCFGEDTEVILPLITVRKSTLRN